MDRGLSASDVCRKFGPSWTDEDHGRLRSGIEVAAMVLRAAGYTQPSNRPREWVQQGNTKLPGRVRVLRVANEWPHTVVVVGEAK